MKIITSTAVPLTQENIDTDQIIPSRFLKATTREGFGENLFIDWRDDPDFVLNNPTYSGQILVAGRNFGCGSSREHAAWALKDYGFNVVISSFFADIFKSNALNNLLLPIQVSDAELQQIFTIIEKDPKAEFVIDLQNQTLQTTNNLPAGRQGQLLATSYQLHASFDITPYKKLCFMQGLDDITYLLSLKNEISEFETRRTNDYSFTTRSV